MNDKDETIYGLVEIIEYADKRLREETAARVKAEEERDDARRDRDEWMETVADIRRWQLLAEQRACSAEHDLHAARDIVSVYLKFREWCGCLGLDCIAHGDSRLTDDARAALKGERP